MSFELKTQIDEEGNEKEIIEETKVTENTTIKLWNNEQLEAEIAFIDEQILELEARRLVLETQITKFSKEITKG